MKKLVVIICLLSLVVSSCLLCSCHKHTLAENIDIPATCTIDGLKTVYCLECDYTTTKTIPATGHKFESATCSDSKICTVCGEKEGSPLGHTTEDGICERCGKYFECGWSLDDIDYLYDMITDITEDAINLKTNISSYGSSYFYSYRYSYDSSASSIESSLKKMLNFANSKKTLDTLQQEIKEVYTYCKDSVHLYNYSSAYSESTALAQKCSSLRFTLALKASGFASKANG